jgi:gamma-glutamyltranspeptidase
MINLEFGSKVVSSMGINLNNGIDDFSTPGQVNSFGLHPVRKTQNLFLSVGVCPSNFNPTS